MQPFELAGIVAILLVAAAMGVTQAIVWSRHKK